MATSILLLSGQTFNFLIGRCSGCLSRVTRNGGRGLAGAAHIILAHTHTHTHLCQRVTHVSIFQCFANRHLFLRLWNNFFFLLLPSPDKKFRWENKTPKRNNKIISLNLPWDDRNILWRRCRTGRWSCTLCICTTSGPWPMSTSWR
jgi:hypothetical protein